jgi:hypothetical protein
MLTEYDLQIRKKIKAEKHKRKQKRRRGKAVREQALGRGVIIDIYVEQGPQRRCACCSRKFEVFHRRMFERECDECR